MTATGDWHAVAAAAVVPGERVRIGGQDGVEVTASRIEPRFLDRPGMIAFIEDTKERWLKVPVTSDARVEVVRPG